MSTDPKTLADIADFLVAWNDKATRWMKAQVEYWKEDSTDDPDWIDISFKRPELELFLRNQEAADKWLRLVAEFVKANEVAK